MNILVVGSGGREHAIVWKLAQSKNAKKIYCAPGNGGIGRQALSNGRGYVECVNIQVEDIDGLVKFAQNNNIDLTIVGPEIPLVLGIVDEFTKLGLKIFGPTKAASCLEGSKVFSKNLMLKYGIPTANGEVFGNSKDAISYIRKREAPLVVKADGLAAGKGVIVCRKRQDAFNAVRMIMDKKAFGDAGGKIIVEECLTGEEVSILAFSDGKNIVPLVPSQDHKRIFDNDKGPNTGGMGAYSPVRSVDEKLIAKIKKEILGPTVKAMADMGIPYKGILYAGIMLTEKGPKTLEFNARFGDPETQVVLARMESDLLDPILATVNGNLSNCKIIWKEKASVCVVVASGGYPDKYEKGFEIEGLDPIDTENIIIFHAGTKHNGRKFITNGGRVLGVTALGSDIDSAVDLCYNQILGIKFDGMYYRKDIAKRGRGWTVNIKEPKQDARR